MEIKTKCRIKSKRRTVEGFDKQFEFINSERDSIIWARARSFIDFEPLLYKVLMPWRAYCGKIIDG